MQLSWGANYCVHVQTHPWDQEWSWAALQATSQLRAFLWTGGGLQGKPWRASLAAAQPGEQRFILQCEGYKARSGLYDL